MDRKRRETILFYSIVTVLSVIMLLFVSQKKGFHEDEIFSYGSSNYAYDNVFQATGEKDVVNEWMDTKIMKGGFVQVLQQIGYYITHTEEVIPELQQLEEARSPVWKTKEQVKQYLTIDSVQDVGNLWSVYYHQSRDVHPPLFYFLVHIVSSLWFGQFSVYIIASISLLFFIDTCMVIRKIGILYEKQELIFPSVLLYGLSMGAIASVLFQRMYMMLTFFVMAYLYLNVKIKKQEFQVDKRTKRQLFWVILFGFLTQYYFCLFVVLTAIPMVVFMLKQGKKEEVKTYIWLHIKSALIGIVVFPACIYHIFFSYRGVGASGNDTGGVFNFLQVLANAFSLPLVVFIVLCVGVGVYLVYKGIKKKLPNDLWIWLFPCMLYFIIIASKAPYLNLRYIMPILPIVSILLVGFLYEVGKLVMKKDKWVIGSIYFLVLAVSISGFIFNEPQYLYKEYEINVKLAKQYASLPLIYVGDTGFNHLKDLPALMYSDHFLLLHENQLQMLQQEELPNQFMLQIKAYLNTEEIIQKVMEDTQAKSYQIIEGTEKSENRWVLIEK